jgi:hypothetical protein
MTDKSWPRDCIKNGSVFIVGPGTHILNAVVSHSSGAQVNTVSSNLSFVFRWHLL